MITKGRIKLLATLFTGILILFTTGCEDNNSPAPSGSLVADAGADQAVTTGQQVVLDGSSSSDKNGDSFDFAWTFKSKPAGSTATLSGADTDSPTFVPDVAGDYVLQLTISNPNGESTDEVKVTVTAPEGLQEKSGTVQNEHWQKVNGAGEPDYLITDDLSIEGDLIIDPGVIILIKEDVLISVQQSGSLDASGTQTDSIEFTAENAGTPWRGIYINSYTTKNKFDYVKISYAGSSDLPYMGDKASVGVNGDAQLSVKNSSINNGQGYGILFKENATISGYSNNNFRNNAKASVFLYANQVSSLDAASMYHGNVILVKTGSINSEDEAIWQAPDDGTAYQLTGSLTVDKGWVVNAGATILMNEDEDIYVSSDGYLTAMGTSSAPVVFTAADPASPWKGIAVNSKSVHNDFSYVQIEHTGSSKARYQSRKAALSLNGGSSISLSNCTFKDNPDYGLNLENTSILNDFSDNNFEQIGLYAIYMSAAQVSNLDASSTFNGSNVFVYGSSLSEDTEVIWGAFDDGTAYHIDDRIDIESGLKITEGAVFKFAQTGEFYITSSGYMMAQGTASNMIQFLPAEDGVPWMGIGFNSNSSKNIMDYTEVAQAGFDNLAYLGQKAAVGVHGNERLTLTNSNIHDSEGYGVFVGSGATVNDILTAGNTFSGNMLADLQIQ